MHLIPGNHEGCAQFHLGVRLEPCGAGLLHSLALLRKTEKNREPEEEERWKKMVMSKTLLLITKGRKGPLEGTAVNLSFSFRTPSTSSTGK